MYLADLNVKYSWDLTGLVLILKKRKKASSLKMYILFLGEGLCFELSKSF